MNNRDWETEKVVEMVFQPKKYFSRSSAASRAGWWFSG